MKLPQTYPTQFYAVLKQANKTINDLPLDLKDLIEAFESAKQSWDLTDTKTKEGLLDAIIQSDALIAALIFKKYDLNQTTPVPSIDKVKLMALKAKALQLKWKLNSPNI